MIDSEIQKKLQSLRIIWIALSLAPAMLWGVVLFIKKDMQPEADLIGKLDYIALVMAVAIVPASGFVYSIILKNRLAAAITPTLKADAYIAANILKGAMLEGPSLFAGVAYLLTQTTWLVFVSLTILVIMTLQRPTEYGFRADAGE